MLNRTTINHIENAIGYHFHDEQLLTQAFTRSSYHYEHLEAPSNEMLEFYGDAVLSLAISDLLLEQYATRDNRGLTSVKNEGDLSAIRSALTNKAYLAKQMARLDLQRYLRISVGDAQKDVQNEKSVLEDLLESIVGAIYADSNKDLRVVKCVVQKVLHVAEFLTENDRNVKISYKNSLQEWCQKNGFSIPEYALLSFSNDVAEVVCTLIELNVFAHGTGKNKKEAEINAAKLLLERLEKEYVPSPEKMTVTLENAINALQEWCQAKKCAFPEYKKTSDIIQNDNSHEITVRCTLNGLSVNGVGSRKAAAKKLAALEMLKLLGLAD